MMVQFVYVTVTYGSRVTVDDPRPMTRDLLSSTHEPQTAGQMPTRILIDRVKVLRPTRHKIRHFGDALPSQPLGCSTEKN